MLAFFLAVGLGAHALDEFRSRPLATRISDVWPMSIAMFSLAGALAIGVVASVTISLWAAPFVLFGGFIVVAYNLEWWSGRFHSDMWFGLAWGAFPALVGYWANAERLDIQANLDKSVGLHHQHLGELRFLQGDQAAGQRELEQAIALQETSRIAYAEAHDGKDFFKARYNAFIANVLLMDAGIDAEAHEAQALTELEALLAADVVPTDLRATIIEMLTKTDPDAGPQGITTFLIEKDFPGFSVAQKLDKLGMRGSETGELVFQDCEVPAENVLGTLGEGVNVLMSGLDFERTVLAAGPLGIMAAAMDIVMPYIHERRQFGKPIGTFQLMQGKLADMYVAMNAARAYV